MLPAGHRLRRSADFAVAVRKGRRAGRGTVVVQLTLGEHVTLRQPGSLELPGCSASAPARAGFVVSKAVGNAVVRNKVKRRLRHLVAARIEGYPDGTTLVVRALPQAASAPYDQLERDLTAALAAATRPKTAGRPPEPSAQRTGSVSKAGEAP